MKKKIAVALAALFGLTLFAGCSNKTLQKYGEEEMTKPFWTQNTMYNEPVLLTLTAGEQLAKGNLAFEPKGKIKITDPLMASTYEEGKDFTVSGRTITATENTSMPYLEEKVLYGIDLPAGKGLNGDFKTSEAGKAAGWEHVLYTESAFLLDHQVLVTYDYDKTEWKNIPAFQGDKLPNTMNKLKNKEALDIVIYGDSVATGCNCTGGDLQTVYEDDAGSKYLPYNREPFTPSFPEMFASALTKAYGAETTIFGAAKGGMDTNWGARNAANRVVNPDMGYNPDLVPIHFATNDATLSVAPDLFRENIEKMIADIRAASSKTVEFILIGPMHTNPYAEQANEPLFGQFIEILKEVAEETEGVAFTGVGALHAQVLENKRYHDMSANGINHPNDFLVRLYAMALSATLIEY